MTGYIPMIHAAAAAVALAILCGASHAGDRSSSIPPPAPEFVTPVVPAIRATDDNRLFVASIAPAGSGIGKGPWPGRLVSVTLNADGTIPRPVAVEWDAASRLAQRSPSARKIYTSSGGARTEFSASFVAPSMLGVSGGSERDGVVEAVRSLRLGDISHPSPVLVGAPSPFYFDPDGPVARRGFAQRYAKRKRVILAFSDDGILHAFHAGNWDPKSAPPGYDAGTGDEEWAYIPGFLLDRAKDFSRHPLTRNHYADSPLTVADVWIDGDHDRTNAKTEREWFTYAIGGAARSGKGYFALDITDPDSSSYPRVAWELTRTSAPHNSPYLGETWSAPAIGKIRKGTAAGGKENGYDRWVAIVGAGKSEKAGSIEGRAILVLDAATGQVLSTLTHERMGEVVAPPTIVNDRDGYVERVYVGDLDGNLWRVVVDDASNFRLGGNPFFTVTGTSYDPSIYAKAAVARGSGPRPHWWIYFGTGDRENPAGTGSGAIFGVADDDVLSGIGTAVTNTRTENDLTQNNPLLRNPLDDAVPLSVGATKKGWYAAFPATGEKMLAHPTVFGNNLFFSTFVPGAGNSPIRGTARVYGFAVAGDGAHPGRFALRRAASSASPDTRRVDVADAGIPSAPVVSVSRSGGATLYLGAAGSEVRSLKIPAPSTTKSLRHWREIR